MASTHPFTDHYATLEVSPTASKPGIEAASSQDQDQPLPDHRGGDYAQAQAIYDARSILTDPVT